MNITATHINYFHICHRKLWLFANGIRMEHTSEKVADGKLAADTSYLQRPDKYVEMEIEGSKIDFYDPRNKVVHEIKRTSSMETAHEWQVKYYIWLLERNGIADVTGRLEYPKLREIKEVCLEEGDRANLQSFIDDIRRIIAGEVCPGCIHKSWCKKCAYYDFCYIED